ncbi:MAG: protease complex subunit PrcB family protein [Gemmatimonadaceae bacterium]
MKHPGVVLRALIVACAATNPQLASGQQPGRTVLRDDGIEILVSTHAGFAFRKPLQLVIRDSVGFAAAWRQVVDPRSTSVPRVNFGIDEVILVAVGERSSTGFGVEVERIVTSTKEVVVYITLRSPGPHCGTLAMITSPVVLVRHRRPPPRNNKLPVRFVERRITATPCQLS